MSLNKLIDKGRKYIDYRMGIIGSLIMGSIVFYINYHSTEMQFGQPDVAGAVTAALKQATYTFFFGGFIMKLSERIATSVRLLFPAILLGCIVPAFIAVSLTFGLHSLKGTPEPVKSTIPTLILIVPGTLVWGVFQRRTKGWKNKPYK